MLSDHAVKTTSITFNERLYTASYFLDGSTIVALIDGNTIRIHKGSSSAEETVRSELRQALEAAEAARLSTT